MHRADPSPSSSSAALFPKYRIGTGVHAVTKYPPTYDAMYSHVFWTKNTSEGTIASAQKAVAATTSSVTLERDDDIVNHAIVDLDGGYPAVSYSPMHDACHSEYAGLNL